MSSRPLPAVCRVLASLAAGVALAACDITIGQPEFTVREEKTFAVTGSTEVSVTTFDGSIEVRGWDRQQVSVEIQKHGPDQATVDAMTVEAVQTGNRITVDIPRPSRLDLGSWRRSPGASLVVTVPVQSTLVLRSGDGSMAVGHVTGKVDVQTEDGSVRAEAITGDLTVHTGDGSVRVKDAGGRVDVETRDGSVGIEGVLRGLRAETKDGSVAVTARTGSRMDEDWVVTTGDGSIRVEVPAEFSAEVDAESGDGSVRIERLQRDVAPSGRGESSDGRHAARGRLGAGGRLLKLRSGSGNVTVTVW